MNTENMNNKKKGFTSEESFIKNPRSYGYISSIGDGVASVTGFPNAKFGEYVQITALGGKRVSGIVLNLDFDKVGIAILGNDRFVICGNLV